MSLKIKRIITDLADTEVDIQILALTTIPRVSPDTRMSAEELAELRDRVEKATESENADVVFLARKALNCLGRFSASDEDGAMAPGGAVESRPVAGHGRETDQVPGKPSAIEARGAAVGGDGAPATEGTSPAGLVASGDEAGSSAPGTEAPSAIAAEARDPVRPEEAAAGGIDSIEAESGPEEQDEAAAVTVLREPSGETLDLERQLVSETDERRLATLLAALATDPAASTVLHRVVPFLQHDNDRVRANAVEVFEKAGGPEHMQFIVPLLKDGNNRVRSNAIKALAVFGHPQAKFHLAAMLRSPEVSMRESAVFVLAELKSLEMLDLLLGVLEDPYEGIRLRAVRALAFFNLPEVVAALKARIDDDDESVREAAIEILTDKGVNVNRLVEEAALRNEGGRLEEILGTDLESKLEKAAAALEGSRPVEPAETSALGDSPASDASSVAGGTPGTPAESVQAGQVPAAGTDAREDVAQDTSGDGSQSGRFECAGTTQKDEADARPVSGNDERGAPAGERVEGPGGAPEAEGASGKQDHEEAFFHKVVHGISRELRQREQRARLSRMLFKTGISVYETCRKGNIREVSLVAVYYEVVKYQEYLYKLSKKLDGSDEESSAVIKSGIDQYKNRIRDCFIKLGRLAVEGHRKGRLELEPTRELQAVLKILGS